MIKPHCIFCSECVNMPNITTHTVCNITWGNMKTDIVQIDYHNWIFILTVSSILAEILLRAMCLILKTKGNSNTLLGKQKQTKNIAWRKSSTWNHDKENSSSDHLCLYFHYAYISPQVILHIIHCNIWHSNHTQINYNRKRSVVLSFTLCWIIIILIIIIIIIHFTFNRPYATWV